MLHQVSPIAHPILMAPHELDFPAQFTGQGPMDLQKGSDLGAIKVKPGQIEILNPEPCIKCVFMEKLDQVSLRTRKTVFTRL